MLIFNIFRGVVGRLLALPSYRQHPPAIDPGDTPLQPLPPGASSEPLAAKAGNSQTNNQ